MTPVKPSTDLATLRRTDGVFVGTQAALSAMVRPDPRRPVWVSDPQPAPAGGPSVVYVRLVGRRDRRTGRRVPRRWIAAGVAVGLAVVGVAVWVLVTWLAAHLAVVVLVVLVVLYGLGAAKTGCPGLHCAGCRHR